MNVSTPTSHPKPTGTPFAGPSSKPWLVRPPPNALNVIDLTVTVFCRQEFGERYLNPVTLLLGGFSLAGYLVLMRLYAIYGWHSVEVPVPIFSWLTWLFFALAYVALASSHLFAAVRRREMFPDEFSYSAGRPRAFFRRLPFMQDEWEFERFYQPALCIGLGLLLLLFRNWFGPYLVIAGGCAFRIASTKFYLRRELELNTLDAMTTATTVPRFESTSPTHSVQSVVPAGNISTNDSDGGAFERLKARNPDLARQMRPDIARDEKGEETQ
ncbi:MAG TPA: hypothetical protein VHD56_17510 [Tepidisphaeraceae bacterium]|jgi:hypothetical protein|nr:hypothetical protein [Tepidisphaeraceae bacterium]